MDANAGRPITAQPKVQIFLYTSIIAAGHSANPSSLEHPESRRECNGADGLHAFMVSTNQDQALSIVIAVVDDDEQVREALIGLMKSLGYRAAAFGSAEEFLNSNRRRGAACLIADVQMPGMTGPELYDWLVASGERIPTILITAYPNETVRARALHAGVQCFLTKPFSEDDLLECIRRALASPVGGEGAT